MLFVKEIGCRDEGKKRIGCLVPFVLEGEEGDGGKKRDCFGKYLRKDYSSSPSASFVCNYRLLLFQTREARPRP